MINGRTIDKHKKINIHTLFFVGMIVSALFVAAAPILTDDAYGQSGGQVPSNRMAVLAHGINMARWFPDPYLRHIEYYTTYVSPEVLNQIKSAGFTYIRVPLSPFTLQRPDGSLNMSLAKVLVEQMTAVERAGLGVMVQPQRQKWHLENNAHDRELLAQFWDQLAPMLASLNQDLTFPEILNEPNFSDEGDWDDLQVRLYQIIRSHLPHATIVATGNHWSKVEDLPKVRLLPDGNVVYAFHFYESPFLTSMGKESVPQEDMSVFSSLVFPVNDKETCMRAAELASGSNTRNYVKYYCNSGWTAVKILSILRGLAEWGRQNNVIIINNEFGIRKNRSMPTRLAYLRAVREACEAEGMGWALWGYDDDFGFGIHLYDKSGPQTLDPRILEALGLSS